MNNTDIAAGAFYLRINNPGWYFRVTEFMANNRAKLTSLIYGDQAMFLKKSVFDKMGGFADIPIMSAYLVMAAFVFVLINLVVDLLYFAVDPRLRADKTVAAGHAG